MKKPGQSGLCFHICMIALILLFSRLFKLTLKRQTEEMTTHTPTNALELAFSLSANTPGLGQAFVFFALDQGRSVSKQPFISLTYLCSQIDIESDLPT